MSCGIVATCRWASIKSRARRQPSAQAATEHRIVSRLTTNVTRVQGTGPAGEWFLLASWSENPPRQRLL
jgi:hypothetical protein